ncbi:hypothetical protein [Porphyrobacter sp. GA68]|uniref:hypothetical protein n=1 Tax=Porphyrobacter sp. GA68 TaxID=2883480 RepID=UPI001D187B5E|nr:hypothetical protein [Porphyrobacter sp. GA68]
MSHPSGKLLLVLLPVLAGCTAVPTAGPPRTQSVARGPSAPVPATDPAPPATGFIAPTVLRERGLEDVIGQRVSGVERLFGEPRLRVPEGDALKLQFTGRACVLDVFLYPTQPGAEPVATYVEARRASDAEEVDRAACVRALRR